MLDLPFQDSAGTAKVRRIVLGEIQRTRERFLACLRADGPPTFEWWGTAHRIDRRRWLILGASDDAEDEDVLALYGGDSRSLHPIDAIDLFAWLVAGKLAAHSWMPIATQLLNLVVVAPLLLPACEPLFWVALNIALDPEGPDDVMDLMRPMTFDMSTYPASRDAAADVRARQADFFRAHEPDLLPGDWAALDEQAWAGACQKLVAAARYGIEWNIFRLVAERAIRKPR